MAKNQTGPRNGQERCLRFLYDCLPGRVLLRLCRARWVSRVVGAYMNSPLSAGQAKRTAKKWRVDPSQFEGNILRTYNAFFTRKRKTAFSPDGLPEDALLSPADSRLTVVPLREGIAFPVKQSPYTVSGLLGDEEEAKRYENGYAFVFRLSVEDYHRYAYPDDGKELSHYFLPGTLHTVNPIALEKLPVFHRNCREVTLLDCERCGRIAFVEVGAMLVGRIVNRHPSSFVRGEEKGYFEFGGSTVVLLLGPERVTPTEQVLQNSLDGVETVVRLGEPVGKILCKKGTNATPIEIERKVNPMANSDLDFTLEEDTDATAPEKAENLDGNLDENLDEKPDGKPETEEETEDEKKPVRRSSHKHHAAIIGGIALGVAIAALIAALVATHMRRKD